MRGIGPARATELAKAGVETVLDLLLHLPFRYEDRSRIAPISALVPDGPATTVKGAVLSSRLIRTRRFRFTIFEAILDDGSGTVRLVFFNQPYLEKQLAKGKTVYAYGAPELATGARRGLVLKNPSYELEETDDPLSVGRVVPIYRKLPGLTPRLRRRTVASLLDAVADRLPERLPAEIRARLSLPSLAASLHEAHFPGSAGGSTDPMPWESRRSPHLMRLVFEEFLEFQLLLMKRRRSRALATAPRLVADDAIRARLKEVLPFALTKAQRRVITEIRDDVRSGRPMRRLLQGDVGSGKTIVAVLSALLAAERGYQTAFMAPTEVLAEQHARTVFHLLARTRFRGELLTGRVKGKKRSALLDQLAGGRIDVLVGTHALLTDPVAFLRLGLAVVDEQHRFGVAQRAALSSRVLTSGERPHLLVMSATPIPRSLALTLWGDLDVSTLDERPPGRHPIATRILPSEARASVLSEVDAEVAAGGQAYVVMPLVEESDKIDAVAVEKHVSELRRALPLRRVGMVHGRVAAEDRETTMAGFAARRIDVLAATTVIEVGVDVPNASYLVVENAERFGLAQLHQLRGRVGRGSRPSRAVFLLGEGATEESRARLEILARTEDGFAIAEEDLRRRGPGDALGTRQSGVPLFRVGDLIRDLAVLRKAREEAERLEATGGDAAFAERLFFRAGEIPESD